MTDRDIDRISAAAHEVCYGLDILYWLARNGPAMRHTLSHVRTRPDINLWIDKLIGLKLIDVSSDGLLRVTSVCESSYLPCVLRLAAETLEANLSAADRPS